MTRRKLFAMLASLPFVGKLFAAVEPAPHILAQQVGMLLNYELGADPAAPIFLVNGCPLKPGETLAHALEAAQERRAGKLCHGCGKAMQPDLWDAISGIPEVMRCKNSPCGRYEIEVPAAGFLAWEGT